MKILIVDDDPRLRELVGLALEREGYRVITASDGALGLTHAMREAPDLIVLDVGLPEMDGFEVCRKVRAHSDVPILFLTARDDEIDRILGLEMGADDYVTKPFSPRELVARVRAILKRTQAQPVQQVLQFANLTLDAGAHECRVADRVVSLTAREFEILSFLMKHPGQLVRRQKMVDAIWGARSDLSDRTIDSHIRNLRSKLGKADCSGVIETLHGVGLRLVEPEV